MTEQDDDAARDEVLFAFHKECKKPSAQDVIAWTERYPEFADDIREHAAIRRDWDADADEEVTAADEVVFARGRSHALNALHNARASGERKTIVTPGASFDQLMADKAQTIPKLASEIGIARGVLAALFGGRMAAPVGARLVDAVRRTLAITVEQFDAALRLAWEAPRLGHAKATDSAAVHRQSYEDVVRDSSMPDDRKSYWLGKD